MDLIFLNDIEMIPSIGRERGLAYKLQIEDTSSLFSASFIPLFNLYISDRIVEYSDIFRNRHKSYIAKQYHGSWKKDVQIQTSSDLFPLFLLQNGEKESRYGLYKIPRVN